MSNGNHQQGFNQMNTGQGQQQQGFGMQPGGGPQQGFNQFGGQPQQQGFNSFGGGSTASTQQQPGFQQFSSQPQGQHHNQQQQQFQQQSSGFNQQQPQQQQSYGNRPGQQYQDTQAGQFNNGALGQQQPQQQQHYQDPTDAPVQADATTLDQDESRGGGDDEPVGAQDNLSMVARPWGEEEEEGQQAVIGVTETAVAEETPSTPPADVEGNDCAASEAVADAGIPAGVENDGIEGAAAAEVNDADPAEAHPPRATEANSEEEKNDSFQGADQSEEQPTGTPREAVADDEGENVGSKLLALTEEQQEANNLTTNNVEKGSNPADVASQRSESPAAEAEADDDEVAAAQEQQDDGQQEEGSQLGAGEDNASDQAGSAHVVEEEENDEEEEDGGQGAAAVANAASAAISMASEAIMDAVKFAHDEQTELIKALGAEISTDLKPFLEAELTTLSHGIELVIEEAKTSAQAQSEAVSELKADVERFPKEQWEEVTMPFLEKNFAEQKEEFTTQIQGAKTTLQDEGDRQQQETMQTLQQIQQGATMFQSEVALKFGVLDEQQGSMCEMLTQLNTYVGQLLQYKNDEAAAKEAEWKKLVELREARHQQLPGSGTKLRVIVNVEDTSETTKKTDMLVVSYSNDYVSDVIASTLRRAMASKVLPENIHPSQCNLYSTTPNECLLFAEDCLDDVGVVEGSRLTLKTGVCAPVPAASKLSPYEQMQRITNGSDQPNHHHVDAAGGGGGYQRSAVASASSPPSLPTREQAMARANVSSGRVESYRPPTPPHVTERIEKRVKNTLAFEKELCDIVLEEDMARRFCDREELERRLSQETERMERDPILAMERRIRVTVAKKDLHELRVRLVDRATYAQSEVHRTAARGTLDKLTRVLENPMVTVEAMNQARQQSELALRQLTASTGEDTRVEMMKDAVRTEEKRKDDAVENIKELIHVVEHKCRIPDNLYGRAETLINKGNSCVILSGAMSRDEVQGVRTELEEFVASLSRR